MTTHDDFEEHRPMLLGLAYRILGDLVEAEDIVQEASVRWHRRTIEVDAPRAYLSRVVTNLCLNERGSARQRREHYAGDRLPDPVDLLATPLAESVERTEAVSMALMVVLQRLTPAERAVFVLHEVFDFGHAEIAEMLAKTEVASRQLLRRARAAIDAEKRTLETTVAEQRRLLRAFVDATTSGDVTELASLLTDDAIMVADAGPGGARFGRVRNLPGPLHGGSKIAAFLVAAMSRGPDGLQAEERDLNGGPALFASRDGKPFAVLSLAVADGRIERVFLHADPARLERLL